MAAEILIKPCIFYGLSHMKAQFLVSVRILFEKFILSVFGKKRPLFDLHISYIRRFNIYCYYSYTAEHAENNTTYLK